MMGEIISFWKHKLPDKEPLDKASYPHFKHLETNFLDSQKMCEETSPEGSNLYRKVKHPDLTTPAGSHILR